MFIGPGPVVPKVMFPYSEYYYLADLIEYYKNRWPVVASVMLIWLTLFDSVRLILQSMLSSKFEPLPAASMIMNGCLRQNVINAGNSKAAFRQQRFCCDQRLGEWGAINQKKLQLIATQTRQSLIAAESLKSDRGFQLNSIFHQFQQFSMRWAMDVSQLPERSLLTPENPSSNPAITNFIDIYLQLDEQKKRKRPRMSHFTKQFALAQRTSEEACPFNKN